MNIGTFLSLLLLMLIGLKLTNYLDDWPWWLVFAPAWVPVAVFMGGFVLWFAWAMWKEKR